ncbi:MAG: hypothetical protein CSA51_03245 [Gammaproteobacteria bacterium]|nr:MAG: hypothetical protein CSA51_03245 [Gammaproteobacteria bacterium]
MRKLLFVLFFLGAVFVLYMEKSFNAEHGAAEAHRAAVQSEKTSITKVRSDDIAESRAVAQDEAPYNDDYSDIYQEIGPKGVASIYPELPHELYSENLERAKQGDPVSQYRVSKALKECTGVPDYEYIDELKNQGELIIDQELDDKLYRDAAFCEAMFAIVPREKIKEEYTKWFNKALLNGDKMALAQHWSENMESFDKERARAILLDALYYGDNRIYAFISYYYAYYFAGDIVDEKAWEMVHCAAIQICDEKRLLEMYEHSFHLYEYEEIVALSNKLTRKINERASVTLQ